jgi:hypothetical protein
MPAALPRSGAPVRPLPHLGVAVVLPTHRPYLLQPEDGTAWLADPAALPADARHIRLGRAPDGTPVALVPPAAAQAVWDAARGRFMVPRVAPADIAHLAYVGAGPTPHFLARPAPAAVAAAGGRPETLVWDDARHAWLAAPHDAGPVTWQPAARAFVRPPGDALATLHPAGAHWVIPPPALPGRATYLPVEAVPAIEVPAARYPAEPVAPRAVPMTRRPLEIVPMVPVPATIVQREHGGWRAGPGGPRSAPMSNATSSRPIAFPGPPAGT